MSRRKPFRKSQSGKPAHFGPLGGAGESPGGSFWIYGHHSVTAALGNPRRKIRRLLATPQASAEFLAGIALPASPALERTEAGGLSSLLPTGAVHQGLAALVEP